MSCMNYTLLNSLSNPTSINAICWCTQKYAAPSLDKSSIWKSYLLRLMSALNFYPFLLLLTYKGIGNELRKYDKILIIMPALVKLLTFLINKFHGQALLTSFGELCILTKAHFLLIRCPSYERKILAQKAYNSFNILCFYNTNYIYQQILYSL